MSRFLKAILLAVALTGAVSALAQDSLNYVGIGRNATTKEVAAWDIDVRPDFKGLPQGSGSVARGQDVWESKCAHCHGFFGESGEVFSPLVGGVTPADIKSGNVANLRSTTFPARTTFMKVATLSTVWDYINRAMPWTAPKTLTTEEVYAVTAFLLNLNGIVPDNYVLSDRNIREVQARMPNRNGMTTAHSMWPGAEFKGTRNADTRNTACMKNCAPEPNVASFLPDFARNAHGNLAEQSRLVGAQHGVDTTHPEAKIGSAGSGQSTKATAPRSPEAPSGGTSTSNTSDNKSVTTLLARHNCTACHGIDKKIVGPALVDVAKKYPGQTDYLAKKIKSGGSGVWGPIPMPAQGLTDADANTLANWLSAGAGK